MFRPYDDYVGMIRLLACVAKELLFYGIPIVEMPSVGDNDEAGEQQQQ